ncbi:hypothetical protein BHE74_00016899 [Ensete ventricosum]|nr:hypothetical protein BHE74_00016899 [Ensete ventricosum]
MWGLQQLLRRWQHGWAVAVGEDCNRGEKEEGSGNEVLSTTAEEETATMDWLQPLNVRRGEHCNSEIFDDEEVEGSGSGSRGRPVLQEGNDSSSSGKEERKNGGSRDGNGRGAEGSSGNATVRGWGGRRRCGVYIWQQ